MRVFRHRDFRILWLGALLSFTGSSIQGFAQGWFVYDLTGDKSKLALVAFCSALPVAVLGPAAGTIADLLNKRVVLVFCQVVFGLGALFLALMTTLGIVQYWHILAVSTVTGLVAAIEMPTRQSIVSRVVPFDELHKAVPMQAMTFNFSRLVGPALGGFLLSAFGVSTCYLVNGLSYLALVIAVLAIRADLRAMSMTPQPIRDLVAEGAIYTFRSPRLRVLFLLECSVAAFAMQYLILLPALARDMWRVDEIGLSWATMMVGVGAVAGLLWVSNLPRIGSRINAIRFSILGMGVALLALSQTHALWVAVPLVGLAGMTQVVQFNTTNTLFQILSPPRLRGRVLAMHMWAMAGLSPMGALFFGWLAQRNGLPQALSIGGGCVLACGVWGWSQSRALSTPEPSFEGRSSEPE